MTRFLIVSYDDSLLPEPSRMHEKFERAAVFLRAAQGYERGQLSSGKVHR